MEAPLSVRSVPAGGGNSGPVETPPGVRSVLAEGGT
jgi:hypothetical protein